MLKRVESQWPFCLGILAWLGVALSPVVIAVPPSEQSVILDIVARDKDGNFIKDLAAEDLEVTDDGTKQGIADFKAAAPEQRIVTLVLGGLGNDGRQYARQAMKDFLEVVPDDVFMTVYVIDRRLYALSPYTNNKKDVQKAVETATSGSFEKYIKRSQELRKDLMKQLGRVVVGGADANRIIIDVLDRSSEMSKEDWSYAALDSLNVLAEELGKAQGRKPIFFFSQGIALSDVMFNRFDFLISAANLANSPIYTVDCRGLLLSGATSSSQSMLEGAREASASQVDGGATSAWQARSLETASQSVRMNVQETLASLSMRTGGATLANTNDTRGGMTDFSEEISNYYQLSYVPDNRSEDGTYHEVEITTDRDDVRLQNPRGYFDAPSVGSASQLLSYELPMLMALGQITLENSFGIQTRFLHFGIREGEVQHTFALEVPLKHFTFSSNEEAGTYTTHFSLMGLLKDSNGEIAEKFSQDYPLQGPLERMEEMQSGNAMFLRNCYVPPGSYTLEAAAYDHGTKQLSATRTPVEIASWPDAPVLSSLMVVDRVDPISDESKELDNPLRYQGMKIAPNLGTPLKKDPEGQLGFYCVVYPTPKISAKPVVGLVFFKDGQPLFQGQPPLPPADEQGRVQVVLNLPMANFQAGNYEVTAVVQQGEAVSEEKVAFSIVE